MDPTKKKVFSIRGSSPKKSIEFIATKWREATDSGDEFMFNVEKELLGGHKKDNDRKAGETRTAVQHVSICLYTRSTSCVCRTHMLLVMQAKKAVLRGEEEYESEDNEEDFNDNISDDGNEEEAKMRHDSVRGYLLMIFSRPNISN